MSKLTPHHDSPPRTKSVPITPRTSPLADGIDRFSQYTGKIVSWLSLFIVCLTFLVVLLRYVFDLGWISLQETILYGHSLLFMLGMSYTLQQDRHVRVDIFYRALSQQAQAWVNLLGALCLLLPVCLFIFWSSLDYVVASWRVLEGSREAGGLDLVYLLKSIIPLMALLVTLQGVAQILHSLRIIRHSAETPSS
jgi:TRAP-type mannitol/chloroaromatic compound transport system permease small subunit